MSDSPSFINILGRSLNPRLWLMSVGTVMTGCGAAALQSNFEILPGSLCLLFAVAAQITGNFSYRYFDEKYGFGENIDDNYNTFNEIGISTERVFREAMMAGIIMCGTLGLTLAAMAGWWAFGLGLVIALLVALDFCIRTPLVRTPWALAVTFLLFGPVGVIGTCLVQSQHGAVGSIFSWHDLGPAVYLSIVAGVMACNVHLIFCYSEFEKDVDNLKNTLTVKYGKAPTRVIFLVNTLIMITVMLAIFLIYHPTRWGTTFIASLCCLPGYFYVWARLNKVKDMTQWINLLKITLVSMALLGTVVFAAFMLTGRQEDSPLQYFTML